MSNTNTQQWDRYLNGHWSELQRRARSIREEYDRGGHSEATKHRLVDSLREIRGGVETASRLIPEVLAEHKRGIEWGLERLLVSVQRLEDLPYVETHERQAIQQQVTGIIGMIDRDDLDAAESGVRDIEAHVERLQIASLETEFASLMSGIGAMYQPMVQ
jgi:hypothetical protein